MARRSRDWTEGLAEDLQDPEFARQFLTAAVDEGVPLKIALGKVIRATGVKEFARTIGMPSPNVLRAIDPKHNPTQETLERLLKPFGLRIGLATIKPRRKKLPSRSVTMMRCGWLLLLALGPAALGCSTGPTPLGTSRVEPGGGGASGAGGGFSRGGSGGRSGSAGGSGAASGGMNAAADGGTVPPRPSWHPTLPLGAPGWRHSTVPFCSQRLAQLDPRVWSNANAVYALLKYGCNVLAGDVFCTEPDGVGETLYRNDGTGWAKIQEAGTSMTALNPPPIAQWVVGLSTGKAVLLGGECPVLMVDPQGVTECALSDPLNVIAGAVTNDRLYVLVDDDALATTRSLRELSGGTWRTLLTLPPPQIGIAVAVNGDTVAVSGQTLMAGSASAATVAPLPGVPVGTYSSLWVVGPNDIVAGDGVGQIIRFDGSGWTVTDTGTSDSIDDVWGAPDGTLYFITQSQFGRLRGKNVELFTTPAANQANHYFAHLWGNSSSEVFVAVNDRDYGFYQCGVTFMLWFDGSTFHEF